MKKILYKIIHALRTVYWFVFRPKTKGVACLIENNGKFLMIRNSYGYMQWALPGGGIKSGEAPEKAVHREVLEEVGIEIVSPILLGEYFGTKQYKRDTVFLFYVNVDSNYFKIDNDEVSEAAWFAEKEIPEPRASVVGRALDLCRQKSGTMCT